MKCRSNHSYHIMHNPNANNWTASKGTYPCCVGCIRTRGSDCPCGSSAGRPCSYAAMATDRRPTDIIPSRDTKRPLSLSTGFQSREGRSKEKVPGINSQSSGRRSEEYCTDDKSFGRGTLGLRPIFISWLLGIGRSSLLQASRAP